MTEIIERLQLDLSYWQLDSKEFQLKRKEQWPLIEGVLDNYFQKNKKAINVIKKYYLKGELPDWAAWNKSVNSSDISARSLDLATFLWLHPSSDFNVLYPLSRAFCCDETGRQYMDVAAGMHFLFKWGTLYAINGKADFIAGIPCFQGKATLIFDVIYHDINLENEFPFGRQVVNESKWYAIQSPSWSCLTLTTFWLMKRKHVLYNEFMLMQYEPAIDLTFNVIKNDKEIESYHLKHNLDSWQRAFYRFAHFDVETKKDGIISQYVKVIRKKLDSDDIHPGLSEIWNQAKNSSFTVQKPWDSF